MLQVTALRSGILLARPLRRVAQVQQQQQQRIVFASSTSAGNESSGDSVDSDTNSGLTRFGKFDENGNRIPQRAPASGQGFGERRTGGESTSAKPPKAAGDQLISSLGQLSGNEGRTAGERSNMVMGGENTVDAWKELDEKVNTYPCERSFKCIGTGGEDFATSIVARVESIVGVVHKECIRTRPSRTGKYLTVDVGPVMVTSSEQVIQVYASMKEDTRMVWFL